MENDHDLEAVLDTFGDAPRYEDESWGAVYDGLGGVREYYESLMTALPDLQIDVQNRHITDDEIVLEVVISGTHEGNWRANGSTTTVPRFSDRWACSTSPTGSRANC